MDYNKNANKAKFHGRIEQVESIVQKQHKMKNIKNLLFLLLLFSSILVHGQKDNSLAKKGLRFGKKGEFKKALQCFDQALEINSKNYTALFYKGYAHEQLEEFSKAILSYSEAIEVRKTGSSYYRRGLCYFRNKDYSSALIDYNKAQKYLPNNVDIVMGKASVFLQTEKHEELIEILNSHLTKYPNDYYSKGNKAIALNKVGRHEEALDLFLDLLNEFPAKLKHQIQNGVADTYMRLNRFEEAMEYVNRSINSDPKFSSARITKIEIYLEMDNIEMARNEVKITKELGIKFDSADAIKVLERCNE